jgi:c-di-GMP phosphodiesterase
VPEDVLDRVVIGRQSIHDAGRDVVGYELLFRSLGGLRTVGDTSSTHTTNEIMFSALNIGLARLAGGKRIFLNADADLMAGDVQVALLPDRSVIAVDHSFGTDDAVVTRCRRLVAEGFTVALTGYRTLAEAGPMLDVASIVKMDAYACTPAEIAAAIAVSRKSRLLLVAENVETEDELKHLQDLGYDMFQGYALQQPTLTTTRVVGANDMTRLTVAARVLGQTLDFEDIEDILRTEPGLTYQVLQLASFGRFGETRREVKTIREALVQAGTWRIQNWIALLIARPSGSGIDEGVTNALTRARACELLAAEVGQSARTGFAAGIVSTFEQLLQIPATELRRSLPLSDELREAAFGTESPLARLVCDVSDHQDATVHPRRLSGVDKGELEVAMATAFRWAVEASTALD